MGVCLWGGGLGRERVEGEKHCPVKTFSSIFFFFFFLFYFYFFFWSKKELT